MAGRPVRLTPTEYELLFELSVHAGRVLTHDQLLQRVWGLERTGEPWLVRRKLGDDTGNPTYIPTELRVGYRMPRARGRNRRWHDRGHPAPCCWHKLPSRIPAWRPASTNQKPPLTHRGLLRNSIRYGSNWPPASRRVSLPGQTYGRLQCPIEGNGESS